MSGEKGRRKKYNMLVVGHGRMPAGISVMPGSYFSYLTFDPNKRYSSPNIFCIEGNVVCLGFR